MIYQLPNNPCIDLIYLAPHSIRTKTIRPRVGSKAAGAVLKDTWTSNDNSSEGNETNTEGNRVD